MIDYESYEFEYDYEVASGDRRAHRLARMRPGHQPKKTRSEILAEIAAHDDTLSTGFETTYRPSRYERGWLIDALGPFYAMGDITDVLRLVKGGKEACVYLCAANPDLGVPFLAAKVYRPRKLRALSNDALYRHGRTELDADGNELRDDRALRAIRTGTERGKQLRHVSWMAHEYEALLRLSDAGADVPRPMAVGRNVILMSYVGDEGRAAPTLNHVTPRPDEVRPMFERVVRNIDTMLAHECVHGDLSAYNVLYWHGAITLIDFPQVVSPYDNPSARAIFERDVTRVCQYFAAHGAETDARRLADALWCRHVPRDLWLELQPGFEAAAVEDVD